MVSRKYPVGIQTFSEIIEKKYIYVDKTEILYKLINKYKYVFLSRPRRFGKSLLFSTMKEYFSGNRELFKGLKIESLEKEWIRYPVFRFDLGVCKNKISEDLRSDLFSQLSNYEKIYGCDCSEKTVSAKFNGLIHRAYDKTGKKVVILIDEYDAPLLNVLYEENMDEVRNLMRSFFSPVKACDEYIQFAFMTGITKFSQLPIFSELNNLAKISMDDEFSSICGITQDELDVNLAEDVHILAEKLGHSFEQTHDELKRMFDGYHFSKKSEDIYNPFSLMSCFASGEINPIWFDSATPSFLLKTMERYNFRITDTENLECKAESFDVSANDLDSALPLVYQSGYLTIKGYDERFRLYKLALPNDEVRYGLINAMYPSVFQNRENNSDFWIRNFVKDIENQKVKDFMLRLEAMLMSIPYATGKDSKKVTEQNIQVGIYLIFNLMGQFTQAECHTLKGRSDCEVVTPDTVYLFEFKLSDSAEEALKQIDDKDYACKFIAGNRKIIKIGVGFDSLTKKFNEWKMLEV